MPTCNADETEAFRPWRRMLEDLDVVLAKDPAARSRWEVLLYPHIHALWVYRIANWWYLRGHTFMARAWSMFGRLISGIEIHPGATIGRRFFIDHGGAVVIGETVRIGDDVMLYHQVTLGSVGWWRDMTRAPGEARHPVIEDGVIIGTNASVFGPVTIGAGSRIGAHTVVLESLPLESRVAPRSMPLLVPIVAPGLAVDPSLPVNGNTRVDSNGKANAQPDPFQPRGVVNS
jgi:serine O-acetyltransferase